MKKTSIISLLLAGVLLANSYVNIVSAQNILTTTNSGISSSQSSTTSTKPPKIRPEESCLQILAEHVKRDSRFGGLDLSNQYVLTRQDGFDLTVYNSIQWFAGARNTKNDGPAFFYANRNNIGTIISNRPYIASQFVPFWGPAAFRFPYSVNNGTENYGDSFAENIVYTHHIKNSKGLGAFISCGFLHVKPERGFTLADTHNDNYKTNTINASGFELLRGADSPVVDASGNRFIVGKANVPINNWNNIHHMTLELITVAYDNKSDYFNEYETFPLQVKAMTDADNRNDVNQVQEKFLELVKKETCLRLPHSRKDDLPEKCNGEYQSLTKNIITAKNSKNFFEKIIPTVLAESVANADSGEIFDESLYGDETLSTEDLPQGMYFYEWLTYDHLSKINSLNNELLKAHILKALSYGIEKEMEEKSTGDTVEAMDNRVFLACGFDYDQRVKLIGEWIESIDVNTFDIDNITYPDPKLGDCILPFPDARHKNQIIEGSFVSNQYNAAAAINNEEVMKKLAPILELWEYARYDNPPTFWSENSTIIIAIVLLFGGVASLVIVLRKKKIQK